MDDSMCPCEVTVTYIGMAVTVRKLSCHCDLRPGYEFNIYITFPDRSVKLNMPITNTDFLILRNIVHLVFR